MTKQELVQGYEEEIHYQKHMLENLGRWFSLFFILASIGVVLLYCLAANLWGLIIGFALTLLGILGMLLFGYGIYKGRLNVQKVIADFELKVSLLQK
ncbi:PTS fructose transporter subunit IA [Streptococcus pantholopis]|uniref:PTS fructose transporter subunit IA n=1 Tax=Streptococcus pantholopis TaxID=1811193 RepID=A0A172QAA3_9STRE|nr:PTS fructose transporter subunit IA [Streptococcus pantholopis]AND80362.1 PTS fructose transporter subunit IA [Streptococcus pantholopis]